MLGEKPSSHGFALIAEKRAKRATRPNPRKRPARLRHPQRENPQGVYV